jgi:hypothetical protein
MVQWLACSVKGKATLCKLKDIPEHPKERTSTYQKNEMDYLFDARVLGSAVNCYDSERLWGAGGSYLYISAMTLTRFLSCFATSTSSLGRLMVA